MAESRSFTAKFNADSSGMKKGVGEAVQALQEANKALVDNQYRQKDCNKAISDAQKEIKKTTEKIKELEKAEKEKGSLDEKEKKQLDELKTKHKELSNTIEEQKLKLAQLKTEQAAIRGTISSLSKEIADNNKEWTALKATMANLASDGVELLGRKLLELGKSVIAVGEQFSSSMAEVQAISGASAADFELLEQTAREYGSTTVFSASEAAQALKYMALAGWDAQQSVDGLGSVLDLAAAGGMDLARASDIVTDYITAFGLSAKDSAHFSDLMAYAMANSNTNVEQLGEAYKNCAASAASMGYSVEEVTAVLMTMANAGVKGGEAGTTLNTIMTRLATDTKGCASALSEMGIEIFDENDNLKSLSEILTLVTSAFDGMSDKEQAALSKVIAGQNQYTGFQTILKGLSESAKETGQSFGDYAQALEDCDGTSKDMAKTMSNNLSGDIKAMQSAFEELALTVYDSGETPLRDLVNFVTKSVVPAIGGLIDNMDKIVPVFIAGASAVTAYKASLAVQSIIKGVSEATTALTAAKTAETAATKGAAAAKTAEAAVEKTSAAVKAADTAASNGAAVAKTAETAAVKGAAAAKAAETAATEEAAAAQGALNAVQAANPIGLVVGALALLVGGLTSYAAIASSAADRTNEFNSALERASSAYSNAASDAQAQAKEIEILEKEYEKLRTSENLNSVGKERLAYIAEQLQSKLGLEANEVKNAAGEYQQLTDKINDAIAAMQKEAQVQAAKEGYKSAYSVQLEAMQKYQMKLAEIRKQFPELYDEQGNLNRNAYNYDTKDIVAEMVSLQQAANKASEAVEFYSDAMNKAMNETDKLTTGSGAGAEEMSKKVLEGKADLEEFYNVFSSGAEQAEYNLERANKALEDNRGQIKDTADEAEKTRKELLKLDTSSEDYDKKKESYEELKTKLAQLKTERVGLTKAVREAKEAYEKEAWAAKTLSEKLAELWKQASAGRAELSSLADSYNSLNDGQALSLDNILNLAAKYPEYSAELLSAAGNADKQREAINKLYELKKKDLILTLEKAREEIRASNETTQTEINNTKKRIEMAKDVLSHIKTDAGVEKTLSELTDKLKELSDELESGKEKADAYTDSINNIANIDISSYKPSGSGGGSGSGGSSSVSAEKVTFVTRENGGWLEATGDTRASAQLNFLDKAVQLGKYNEQQQIEYLNNILRAEQVTADERYQIQLKLNSLSEKLREESDKKREESEKAHQEAEKKAMDELKERQKLALAAYQYYIEGQQKALKDANSSLKADADAQIKAIDAEMAKRQQQKEDDSRKKELDMINAQLRYGRNDEITKLTLEAKKQDIINQQAEADYQRKMEQKKLDIQETANKAVDNNTAAINALSVSLENFSYNLAKVSGSRTAQQIVSHNTKNQNIKIIQSSHLSTQQINAAIKAIYDG